VQCRELLDLGTGRLHHRLSPCFTRSPSCVHVSRRRGGGIRRSYPGVGITSLLPGSLKRVMLLVVAEQQQLEHGQAVVGVPQLRARPGVRETGAGRAYGDPPWHDDTHGESPQPGVSEMSEKGSARRGVGVLFVSGGELALSRPEAQNHWTPPERR
jgi:hypothetical protein